MQYEAHIKGGNNMVKLGHNPVPSAFRLVAGIELIATDSYRPYLPYFLGRAANALGIMGIVNLGKLRKLRNPYLPYAPAHLNQRDTICCQKGAECYTRQKWRR